MAKRNVTLSIDPQIWHNFQIHCISTSKVASREIEHFMKSQLTPAKQPKTTSAEREAAIIKKLLSKDLGD